MKFKPMLCISLFALMGCETIRGVYSSQEAFTSIADKSCVSDALMSVKDVHYLESFTKNEESKSWKNEPIHRKIDYFMYEIPQLSNLKISSQIGKKPTSQIIISEEKSENQNYNSISYYNSFGHMNGRDYRDSDKEYAKQIIKRIDDTVVNQCKLDIRIPEPKEK